MCLSPFEVHSLPVCLIAVADLERSGELCLIPEFPRKCCCAPFTYGQVPLRGVKD